MPKSPESVKIESGIVCECLDQCVACNRSSIDIGFSPAGLPIHRGLF